MAHKVIMDAGKTQHLQLARWRSRRADSIVLVLDQRSEDQERQWCNFQKIDIPDQRQSGREDNFFLYQPFCSIHIFSELNEAHQHWGGQSALLSQPIHMLISSRNAFTDRPRITSNHVSLHPVAQSTWHIKLTVTRHHMCFHLYTFAQIHIHIKRCSLCFLLISVILPSGWSLWLRISWKASQPHSAPDHSFFLLNSCSTDV